MLRSCVNKRRVLCFYKIYFEMLIDSKILFAGIANEYLQKTSVKFPDDSQEKI